MSKEKILTSVGLIKYDEEIKNYIKSQGVGLTEDDVNGFIDTKLVTVNENIENKVDKVDGMGLSTNDYTNEDKSQVETNKTDILSLKGDVETLQNSVIASDFDFGDISA